MRISGGLGNQLFQYAFARAYTLRHFCEVQLDTRYFTAQRAASSPHCVYQLDRFRIRLALAAAEQLHCHDAQLETDMAWMCREQGLTRRQAYLRAGVVEPYELAGCYRPQFMQSREAGFFQGNFQSEEYFREYRAAILQELRLRDPLPDQARRMQAAICNCTSVAVHVRRGDYVKLGIVCAVSYYLQAMAYIAERIAGAHFFIFSDDLPWAEAQLCGGAFPCTAVQGGLVQQAARDLELMRSCPITSSPTALFRGGEHGCAQSPASRWLRPGPGHCPGPAREDVLPISCLRAGHDCP